MSTTIGMAVRSGDGTVRMIEPGKVYPTGILAVARHFATVRESALLRDLADEFRRMPGLPVVAVVDERGHALGLVVAQRLFTILGKPFGYDVLSRARVSEWMEDARRWSAGAELFTVAAEALGEVRSEWMLLEDAEGRFAGAFSAQDLAAHLSGMTRSDVERAGALQGRLMDGRGDVRGAHWRVEAWSRMAKGIGGDLHFARRDSDDECFCSLCDVSGKGVEASVLVSMLWGMQRMRRREDSLARFLGELNRAVVDAFHLEKYLTGFFMDFDRRSLRLRVADMGHSHVLVFRGGEPRRVRNSGANLPLGLAPDLAPALSEWKLAPGDVVFVYSDGFVEQEDQGGNEFTEARLGAVVTKLLAAGRPLAEGLREAFDSFRGRVPQQDDLSFLALFVE
ncbi:MAG: SpoIIE family protein phosphatase [Spirochaetales bacterium]|nr:SpoIIE family protein phosphatase [Spirochaetales bacterium]